MVSYIARLESILFQEKDSTGGVQRQDRGRFSKYVLAFSDRFGYGKGRKAVNRRQIGFDKNDSAGYRSDSKFRERSSLAMETQKMSAFLRELRKERVLTQEQAAEALFVSSKTLSRWETGATVPDLETLMKLAEYYRVDIKELIDGERREPDEGPEKDPAAQQKDALQAVAEYGSQREKRSVRRAMLKLLIIFLIIIGIYALIRWRKYEQSLDEIGGDRFFGKVLDYGLAEDGSVKILLDCDTKEVWVRTTAKTTYYDEEIEGWVRSQTKGVYVVVVCEYPLRERYNAEKNDGSYIYPALHIGRWWYLK